MKKILSRLAAFLIIAQSFGAASTTVPAPVKASEITIPIGNTGKVITMQELADISTKDFEKMTGSKLNFANRMLFKAAQRQVRRSINDDGTVNNKKVEKFYKKYGGGGDFNIGGFALGFLLGLIGVLIAYLIDNGKNRPLIKWAWIGLIAWVVIWLIVVVV